MSLVLSPGMIAQYAVTPTSSSTLAIDNALVAVTEP